MARKKEISRSRFQNYLNKNLDIILAADLKEARDIIKRIDPNISIDIDDAVDVIRSILVERIGNNLVSVGEEKINKKLYKKQIKDIEGSSDLLIYNKSGKLKYDTWIKKDLKRVKALQLVKKDKIGSDISKITHVMAEVQTEDVDKITSARIDERNKELEGIKNEIQHLSDILSSDDSDIIIEEKENDQPKKGTWWENIGLVDDPFNINGLRGISKEDFDSILIQNQGIIKAQNFRNKAENSFNLGTNYLVLGKLGTGKTAVVEYLDEFSLDNGIQSFTARIPPAYSSMEIDNQFYQMLRLALRRWYSTNGIPMENTFAFGQAELLLHFTSIMEDFRKGQVKGFFIFVEDLHKQINRKIVFEFISGLQTLTEASYNNEIPLSLIITGTNDWENTFKNDSRLTSVIELNNIVNISDVTPVIASKAISKRFEVFRKDRDSKNKNQQQYKLVGGKIETISKLLNRRRDHTGYRIYFQEIKRDLENGNTNIFSYDPTTLGKELRLEYIKILKSAKFPSQILNKIFKQGIRNWKTSRAYQHQHIVVVLSSILKLGRIKEGTSLLKSNKNKSVVSHLFKIGAITMDKKKNWMATSPIRKFHNRLARDLGAGLDYFLSTYHLKEKDYSIKKATIIKEEQKPSEWKTKLGELKSTIGNSATVSEYLSINLINDLETSVFIPRYETLKGYELIECEDLKRIFDELLRLDLQLLSSNLIGKNIIRNWHQRYDVYEDTQRFIREYYTKTKVADNRSFLHAMTDAVEEIIDGIISRAIILKNINNFSASKPAKVAPKDINRDIQSIIFKDNRIIGEPQIEELQDYLQDLLRQFLFISNSLTFGPYEKRKSYLKKILPKNSPASNRMVRLDPTFLAENIDVNEFEQLQRGEFKIFIEIKNPIYKKEVYQILSENMNMNILDKTIDQFQAINLRLSHDKKEEGSHRIKKYPDFIYNALLVIKHLSAAINDKILNSYVIVEKDDGKELIGFISSYSDTNIKPSSAFGSFINKVHTSEMERRWVSKENSDEFIDICDSKDIHLWDPMDISGRLMDIYGTSRMINIADTRSVGPTFGNMYYAQGIANLIYSIHKNKIRCKRVFGTEYILRA